MMTIASLRDDGGLRSRSRGDGPRLQNRSGNSRVQLSKRLTWALRHGANDLGLRMRPGGFVRLDELLATAHFSGVSTGQVEEMVLADEKGRMSMIRDQVDEGLLIRANQGHSMEGVIVEEQLLTRIDRAEDVPVCVHGTSLANWSSIRKSGLRRMNRTHIHFAAGFPGDEGVISGMRKGCKVFIYIDVAAAMADGINFFRSTNNVILTSGIDGTLDSSYFARVDGVADSSIDAATLREDLEASSVEGKDREPALSEAQNDSMGEGAAISSPSGALQYDSRPECASTTDAMKASGGEVLENRPKGLGSF